MIEKSKRILIIDPDAKIRGEYRTLFCKEGYEVDTCAGITQAIEKIKNIQFDCIIIDTHLPELLGYKAVPIIKIMCPKAEVIVTTAHNSKDLENKVREQAIFYYYIKSFQREELRLAVREVFKKIGKIKGEVKMQPDRGKFV